VINDIDLLREANKVCREARESGNHPFGALLASADGEILIKAGNSFAVDKGLGHAELNVARAAALKYSPEDLESCILYSPFEPCSMCSGGIYWAGIGTLVFGVTEQRLAELTGDNPENLTMSLPCRTILSAGQRKVEVRGPFPELEEEIVEIHKDFW